MEGRESVVMMSGPEGGGSGAKAAAAAVGEAGGGATKESASSTPSPSPSPTPSPSPRAAAPAEVSGGGGIGVGVGVGVGSGGAGVPAAAPIPWPATGVGVGVGGMGIYEELARKKRGRPKKYAPDEMEVEMEMEMETETETEMRMGMGLALSPSSAPSSFALVHHSSHLSAKRSRGRPRGSGRRQLLATLGEWFAFSAGGSFTPHVVTIATGEDVAARILSFSQKGPRAICILSANGAISNGRFEILSLSGSFAISENGGVRSRTGGISVSLAGPDGRVVGGGVAGLLLAASPIQIVVGSFLPNVFKEHKRRANQESTFSPVPASGGVLTSAKPISQATPPDDGCENLTSSLPAGQVCGGAENSSMTDRPPNPNPTPFKVAGGLPTCSRQSTSLPLILMYAYLGNRRLPR
uniref:AT-hook motif nuclear-localized protein n=1 Tax=Ananas comosus var. bracteatus TaxID=296719 RepID=A0A6V7NQA1_ANACO|nr:unnamed protein product [Ananas comosus var. bracteatus]